MKRESESRLMAFCVQQHDRFSTDAWLTYQHPDKDEFLGACLFLSGCEWYGHQHELRGIAEHLQTGSTGHLSDVVRRTGFDCLRFSTMLRRELDHALVAS